MNTNPETDFALSYLEVSLDSGPFTVPERVGVANARELANNVACQLSDGENDPYQGCIEAIMHSVRNGWLSCGCVSDLAKDMARAWRGN